VSPKLCPSAQGISLCDVELDGKRGSAQLLQKRRRNAPS
jgi:hypothetical protein